MGVIKILDENLINKIAAGEVIERPASIVRELIDNSLDAGATEIFIFIEHAGKRLIKIIDNGCGMDEDDIFLSIERHATSKLKTADDLFRINTYGFRGEALASIASISRLTIKSRRQEVLEGNSITIIGGQIKSKNIVGMSVGTEICVENLFFNTPVRKKFLKSDSTEFSHILNIITNHSLANPEKHFKLYSENDLVFDSPKTAEKMEAIINVYGNSIKNKIINVSENINEIFVEAYLGVPEIARKTREHQKIFVNGRCIKNNSVSMAVYNSYKTLLGAGEHPFFVIFINVPPDSVDVNIHPSKSEVRFTDAKFIQDNLEIILKKNLRKSPAISPKISLKTYKIENLIEPEPGANQLPINEIKSSQTSLLNPDLPLNLKSESVKAYQPPLELKIASSPVEPTNPVFKEISNTDDFSKNDIGEIKKVSENVNYKIIGQANNLYIIVELNDKIKLIDQHAAHERMLYNKFMLSIKNEKPAEAQLLLLPVNIELTQSEKNVIKNWLGVLSHLGFELEEFGTNSYLIRSVPIFIGKRADDKRMVLDLIDDIISIGSIKSFDEMMHNLVAMMSCKAAVKAGARLMPAEMKEIVEAVLNVSEVSTCPHGRPTSIDLTFVELEKNFKRRK